MFDKNITKWFGNLTVKGLRKELYSRGYTGISKAKKSVLQDMLLDALTKEHPDTETTITEELASTSVIVEEIRPLTDDELDFDKVINFFNQEEERDKSQLVRDLAYSINTVLDRMADKLIEECKEKGMTSLELSNFRSFIATEVVDRNLHITADLPTIADCYADKFHRVLTKLCDMTIAYKKAKKEVEKLKEQQPCLTKPDYVRIIDSINMELDKEIIHYKEEGEEEDADQDDINRLVEGLKRQKIQAKDYSEFIEELVNNLMIPIFKFCRTKGKLTVLQGNYDVLVKDYDTLCEKYHRLYKSHGINVLRGFAVKEEDKAKLKKMFRDLAMKYHPDHGGDMEMMQFVNDLKAKLC